MSIIRQVIIYSLFTLYCFPLNAASTLSLQHAHFKQVKRIFSFNSPSMRMFTSNSNELRLLQQHQDGKKIVHSRVQQYYAGFPVFGGYAIFHAGLPVNELWGSVPVKHVSMSGKIYKGLAKDLGRPDSDYVLREQEALSAFEARYLSQSPSEGQVEPIIYVDKKHVAHWAYKVSCLISHEDRIPERPMAIIDASSYEPLLQWDNVKRLSRVKGRGFGGNKRVGAHEFGRDFPLLHLRRNNRTGICFMENAHVKVVDMMGRRDNRNKQTMHFLCPESERQWDGSYLTGYTLSGYDQTNGGFSPTNDALYAGNVIFDMYKKWYGVNVLEENGKPKQLLMLVHYGDRYNNAHWDGRQMAFGDGDGAMYPLVSIGVSAHEISHGFTEQHSDLIALGQSGAINESFSDMAAQTAEYYTTGKNDWVIGGEIFKKSYKGLQAFRYMDLPSRDGKSIDNAADYTSELDVHQSCGVYNRLFYLLSTQPGWTVRRAFQVMLTANTDFWTPTTTFDEGACGIIDAARTFNYPIDDIKHAMDEVGVHYADCYENEDDEYSDDPNVPPPAGGGDVPSTPPEGGAPPPAEGGDIPSTLPEGGAPPSAGGGDIPPSVPSSSPLSSGDID